MKGNHAETQRRRGRRYGREGLTPRRQDAKEGNRAIRRGDRNRGFRRLGEDFKTKVWVKSGLKICVICVICGYGCLPWFFLASWRLRVLA